MLNKSIRAASLPAVFFMLGLGLGTKIEIGKVVEEAIEQLIAGIFFASISIQIIPMVKISRKENKLPIILGIMISIALMLTVTFFENKNHDYKKINLTVLGINNVLNGFISSSLASAVQGIMGYIASAWLSAKNLIIGIHIGNVLRESKDQLKGVLTYWVLIPFLTIFGGVLEWFLRKKMNSGHGTFAFSIATILWIITFKLIPTERNNNMLYPLMMYIGFMFIILLNWFA